MSNLQEPSTGRELLQLPECTAPVWPPASSIALPVKISEKEKWTEVSRAGGQLRAYDNCLLIMFISSNKLTLLNANCSIWLFLRLKSLGTSRKTVFAPSKSPDAPWHTWCGIQMNTNDQPLYYNIMPLSIIIVNSDWSSALRVVLAARFIWMHLL